MRRRNVRVPSLRALSDKQQFLLGWQCRLNLCAQQVVLLSESCDTVAARK